MNWIRETFFTITHTETYSGYMILFSLFCIAIFVIYFWFQGVEGFASKVVGKIPKNTSNSNGYNHMNPYDYVPKNPYLDTSNTGGEVAQQDNITTEEQPKEQQDTTISTEEPVQTQDPSKEESVQTQEQPKEDFGDKTQEDLQTKSIGEGQLPIE